MSQVSAMAMRALVAAAEDFGAERGRFLAEAGLTEEQITGSGHGFTRDDHARACRALLVVTGDPAFGLHMGERASFGSYDALGQLAEHSASLREALQAVVRYARIAMDGPSAALREEGDLALFVYEGFAGSTAEDRLMAEFAVTGIVQLVCRFAGAGAKLRHAFFAYPAPAHRAEYTRVFGGFERFKHAFTGLAFDRAWLDRSNTYRSPELRTLLEGRAEVMLARVELSAPAAERVKRWLASQSAREKPTMAQAARALAISVRSLRRRLLEEGASFDDLVEAAQAQHAKQQLADPRHSIQDVAYALGFVSAGAFSRAFRRWTGLSPSAYRATL